MTQPIHPVSAPGQSQPTTQSGPHQSTRRDPEQTGTAAGAPGSVTNQHAGPEQARLHQTASPLAASVRRTSVDLLNRSLADTTVLLTQAKYAHWNLKGVHFAALHELFDELAAVLERHADDLAERVTAVGGQALGTTRMAAAATSIPPLDRETVDGLAFVRALTDRLGKHDANLSRDIEAASQAGDLDTADLLNEVSREVSKYRWFLEAHLQGDTGVEPAATTGELSGGSNPRPR